MRKFEGTADKCTFLTEPITSLAWNKSWKIRYPCSFTFYDEGYTAYQRMESYPLVLEIFNCQRLVNATVMWFTRRLASTCALFSFWLHCVDSTCSIISGIIDLSPNAINFPPGEVLSAALHPSACSSVSWRRGQEVSKIESNTREVI